MNRSKTLRRSTKPLRRSPIKKTGKKGNRWAYVRSQLKIEFERIGVTFCEICGATNDLTMAHRLKRRFITTDEELRTVAILCLKHHEEVEKLPHDIMYERITEIIEKREF